MEINNKFALIGSGVSHSLSPYIFSQISPSSSYELMDFSCEKDIPSLEELFSTFDGLNITAPYKSFFYRSVFTSLPPYIDGVNTIRERNGRFEGVLTDFIAFKKIFAKIYNGQKIIILGDGVMGRMVQGYLEDKCFDFLALSRKKNNLDQSCISMEAEYFLINTCSRDFQFSFRLNSKSFFWDFNYRFKPHDYLRKTCFYEDGESLLWEQARESLKYWKDY